MADNLVTAFRFNGFRGESDPADTSLDISTQIPVGAGADDVPETDITEAGLRSTDTDRVEQIAMLIHALSA